MLLESGSPAYIQVSLKRIDADEAVSKILLYLLLLGCCLAVGACVFVNQPQFGQQSAESGLSSVPLCLAMF
jgi:hypothetical protein